jgi:hypothetical protein
MYARPYFTFLNSKKIVPPKVLNPQANILPFPDPILEPLGFLVKGIVIL